MGWLHLNFLYCNVDKHDQFAVIKKFIFCLELSALMNKRKQDEK